jgi:hypothetical protein
MSMNILIFGASMAVFSAIMWILESMPFVKAIKCIDTSKFENANKGILGKMNLSIEAMNIVVQFIASIIKLWPLAVDLAVTIWLIGAFGFGGSTIGSIIGLTVSNVISVFLLITSRKK